MGGFQSFQWAASYPGFMKGIAASVTAPRSPGAAGQLEALQKRLASDPNWNGGWYYDNGGIRKVLEQIRFETLLNYGQNEILAETIADPEKRKEAMRAKRRRGRRSTTAIRWSRCAARSTSFDITEQYDKLKGTKVLYVNSKTDKLFDIADCPAYVPDMRKAGVDVTYVELPSDKGHMASHADAAMWAPILGAFMKSL